ncbi:MAG TPA: hypothetical protein VJB65_03290 [Patescibacteria group bacterium]|nr:hypothetical protein [Patescibacteria group bacterium]
MQNKYFIEQLLSASQRKKQQLSAQSKDQMLEHILYTASSVSQQKQKKQTVFAEFMAAWKWMVVGGTAAITALLIIVFNWNNQFSTTTQTAELATSNKNETVKISNPTPSVTETPTPTPTAIPASTSAASPTVSSPAPQHTTPSTQTNTASISVISIRDLIGGFGGGGPELVPSEWKIIQPPTMAASYKTNIPLLPIGHLTEKQMRDLTSALGFDSTSTTFYTSEDYAASTKYITNQYSEYNSDPCINRYIEERSFSFPCIYINNLGFVHIEKKGENKTTDGITEALSYISTISHLHTNQLEVHNVTEQASEYETSIYDTYYMIYSKQGNVPNLPFKTIGWSVGTKNGQLVSLFGAAPTAYQPSSPKTFDLISEIDAYNRLLKDIERNIKPYEWNNVYAFSGNVWELGYPDIPNNQISIHITSISLQYEIGTQKEVEEQNRTYQLLPVYTIRGIETNTKKPFKIYIDATTSNSNAKIYSIVDSSANLQ